MFERARKWFKQVHTISGRELAAETRLATAAAFYFWWGFVIKKNGQNYVAYDLQKEKLEKREREEGRRRKR